MSIPQNTGPDLTNIDPVHHQRVTVLFHQYVAQAWTTKPYMTTDRQAAAKAFRRALRCYHNDKANKRRVIVLDIPRDRSDPEHPLQLKPGQLVVVENERPCKEWNEAPGTVLNLTAGERSLPTNTDLLVTCTFDDAVRRSAFDMGEAFTSAYSPLPPAHDPMPDNPMPDNPFATHFPKMKDATWQSVRAAYTAGVAASHVALAATVLKDVLDVAPDDAAFIEACETLEEYCKNIGCVLAYAGPTYICDFPIQYREPIYPTGKMPEAETNNQVLHTPITLGGKWR